MMTSIPITTLFRWNSHSSSEERVSLLSVRWVIGALSFIFAIGSIALLLGPVTGCIRLCSSPSVAMAPTIVPGDRFAIEAFSLMTRVPRRGELIVFRSDGIRSLPGNQLFVKRIVGLPGEHVQIANGKLSINGAVMTMTNSAGPLSFEFPMGFPQDRVDATLRSGEYFVIGDNERNSLDSRAFGTVPRTNFAGRIWFRYARASNAAKAE
jgi:signal peptidase I